MIMIILMMVMLVFTQHPPMTYSRHLISNCVATPQSTFSTKQTTRHHAVGVGTPNCADSRAQHLDHRQIVYLEALRQGRRERLGPRMWLWRPYAGSPLGVRWVSPGVSPLGSPTGGPPKGLPGCPLETLGVPRGEGGRPPPHQGWHNITNYDYNQL